VPNFGNGHSIHVSDNANADATSYVSWSPAYPTAPKDANDNSLFIDGDENF
jgi:hypothetical protein